MLHTKFHQNRPSSSRKVDYSVFTLYGHGSHLGHVTSIMLMNFHFIVTTNLAENGQVATRKSKFNFYM